MTRAYIVLAALAWLMSSAASAQIEAHDVRVFVDTDLVSYRRTSYETAEVRDIESSVAFGPGGSALGAELPGYVGFGLGYAFRPRFLGQIHVSFARQQAIHERYFDGRAQPSLEDPVATTFMLRPELEIALNPNSRGVVSILGGFDIRRARVVDVNATPRFERVLVGMGPVAGLMLHVFLVEKGSLDLGVVAAVDFLSAEGDGPFTDATTLRSAAVSVTLGVSLWP
jgi:hypothetical protein